ncbi:MAG: helix-turn-helix domain-containing protein [Nevskiales bacterium]|nr:helix-turn-helix domain-containing protein [Nevskiales bacterium]
MTIGQNIRKLRLARRMSIKDLARSSGLAASTLYDIERGDQHATTKLHRIAEVLHVSPAELEQGPVHRLKEPAQGYVVPNPIPTRLARIFEHLRQAHEQHRLTVQHYELMESVVAVALSAPTSPRNTPSSNT